MWQKRMWMRLECMRRTDLVRGDLAGRARVGIGTHGSTDSLSFLEMEFSIAPSAGDFTRRGMRSEEHTSELQSRLHLVCRLLLEKKKNNNYIVIIFIDEI